MPTDNAQVCSPFRLWEQHLPELEAESPQPHEGEPRLRTDSAGEGRGEPVHPQDQAQEILERARKQSEHLLEEARGKAALIAESAEQQAMQAVAEAQQQALGEYLGLLRTSFEMQLAQWWRKAELEAVELCAAAAEKVVRDRIPRDDAVVVRAVRESLEQLRGASSVAVRVHPDSAAALNAAAARLAAEFPSAEGLVVECAPTITPGGAIIRSDAGEIDLRVETQLERIRQALLAPEGEPST